jgi:predicted RNA-binding Zn-ribbon protein involved in translation (DUF1610 family)
MPPVIGAPWRCPTCTAEGNLSKEQVNDLKTMSSARCPKCYGAVVIREVRA